MTRFTSIALQESLQVRVPTSCIHSCRKCWNLHGALQSDDCVPLRGGLSFVPDGTQTIQPDEEIAILKEEMGSIQQLIDTNLAFAVEYANPSNFTVFFGKSVKSGHIRQ